MTLSIRPELHWRLEANNLNVVCWLKAHASIKTENPWQAETVHRPSQSNLTEFELICHEKWANIAVYRCAKLVQTYHYRLAAVIAAKWLLMEVNTSCNRCLFSVLIIVCVHVVLIRWQKAPKQSIWISGWNTTNCGKNKGAQYLCKSLSSTQC